MGATLSAQRKSGRLKPRQALFSPLLLLTLSLALLYAFPWLRVPNLFGVAFPLQRIIPWLELVALFILICTRRSLPARGLSALYLTCCTLLLSVILVSAAHNAATSPTFNLLTSLMELSKYVAVFTAGYAVYYALWHGLLSAERFSNLIMLSGVASIILSYIFLGLYWAGFRTTNEILAPTFGGALGAWPTGGLLPRLAGTGAEPQQLSVLFMTPLLIMLNRRYIKRYWFVALLGVGALVLSQSKFSLVSLAVVALFLDLVYKKHRLILISFMLVALPAGALSLSQLPTFSATLEQGLEAGAFVERFNNVQLLGTIIQDNLLLGIGVGQYGAYRSQLLYNDPDVRPDYKANSDLLSIFAETGVVGFAVTAFLLLSLLVRFSLQARRLSSEQRDLFFPYWLGAVTIFLNMFIGYEFVHTFFWINIGTLLHLSQLYSRKAR